MTWTLGEVKINERGMYSVLHSQRGPVAKHIREIGRETVVLAKARAGVKTGALKRSIKMKRDRSRPGEYAVLVGSDVRHALVHHQGKRASIITPRSPGGVLVFKVDGRKVVTTRVRHPRIKANRYLVEALKIAVGR
jgi:hypothetical protein